ncbi:hypothetical protein SAMN04488137_1011 [Fictibacillus solisalsi]|uniref:Uncharacterized protein n=1 Tax=Fictibacillus solisalsi TaxID=459525 RepID=A0A1G9UM62_9BACL|nr:hypothetical protein [Fictibacillus solisalsi]SDM61009.1 hypothetical protein SAMN04488137_1011 [Fictibacillus solisalsi]
MKIIADIGDKSSMDLVFSGAGFDIDAIDKALHFREILHSRGLELSDDEFNFSRAVFGAWNYEGQMVTEMAVCAPCGFGKSTMLEVWATHNHKNKTAPWGGIIAKFKRSQVEEFCQAINTQAGETIAFPLLGKDENMTHSEYLRQFELQKRFPILVMTHKMLELLTVQEKLTEFTKWYDFDGDARRRTQLFIDERPNFINTESMSLEEIERLVDLVRGVSLDTDGYEKPYYYKVRKTSEKLREALQKPINKGDERLFEVPPTEPFFKIEKELFYDWLSRMDKLGNNYNLLGAFAEVVSRGGSVTVNDSGTTIHIGRKVWKEISFMNTFILDSTAMNDKHYDVKPFNRIAPVLPENAYKNLTIHNCYKHNIGKDFFSTHKKGLKRTSKLAREVAQKHNKLAVVVYKKFYNSFSTELAPEVETGNIKLKYFDDERASNEFKDCDAILFLGRLHKGDPYYIEYTKLLTGKDVNYKSRTQGGKTYLDTDVQDFYQQDLVTDRIQGLERTRSYKSKTPKTVYMFSTYEEFPQLILEDLRGATLKSWELPFSLTDKEQKVTAKRKFMEWLERFTDSSVQDVKCKEVYEKVLNTSEPNWKKMKKDREILALMNELGIYFKGQKILKK